MTTEANIQDIPSHAKLSRKVALAAALVAFGDWLFYDHGMGLSLPLFLATLVVGACLMRPNKGQGRDLWVAVIFVILALLPLLEATGSIAVIFGILGAALAAVVVTGGLSRGWTALAISTRRMLLTGAFQLFPDLLRAAREAKSRESKSRWSDLLVGWVLPVLCCAVFVALFAAANPLIEQLLSMSKFSPQRWEIDPVRITVWIVLLLVAWSFLSVRLSERRSLAGYFLPTKRLQGSGNSRLFGRPAVLRSLVIFNVLFAVQSGLDAIYLWGGASLPEGMTYAAYAHRGAYPLIITALLAAVFVLVAMRPGGGGEQSTLMRRLVYLWIGQNVLLVVSSILRLDLYVDSYSLTPLRVAAFVWMLLVAVGLLLIMARIVLRRSNGWLIGANALVLALTLYVCSFVNFDAVIANHNLSYKRETMSKVATDFYAVQSLGPHAIPSLDRFIACRTPSICDPLMQWRRGEAAAHSARMRDWRYWTFRDLRLQHYLNKTIDVSVRCDDRR